MKYAVCSDVLYVFKNKKDLNRFFLECSLMSEGAERERYTTILINSACNMRVSTDEVSYDCDKITVINNDYSYYPINYKLNKRLSIEDTIAYYQEIVKPVLEISKNYNINFSNEKPFEYFGNDSESAYGSMYSFSNYYKDILENFFIEINDIRTKSVSDGKYEVIINNKYIFDTCAWGKFENVLENVALMEKKLKKETEISYE